MRTSICRSIKIDIGVKIGISISKIVLNNMNMMSCDRNSICVGIALEFRIKNSISKIINMSINFSITGTMSGTVRRSICIYINLNNSIIIEGKIFRLALTLIQI